MESLSSFILESALDPLAAHGIKNPARRAGAISTSGVSRRTTLLLVRFRYHILTRRGKNDEERPLLAEELAPIAFAGSPQNAEWLSEEEAEKLLQLSPDANVSPDRAREFLQRVVDGFEALQPHIDETARLLGKDLLAAHQRVRSASRQTGLQTRVEPNLPADVIGVYIYLPKV
jgi:DNA-directed RNA polymerase specialized sigma24 family protein